MQKEAARSRAPALENPRNHHTCPPEFTYKLVKGLVCLKMIAFTENAVARRKRFYNPEKRQKIDGFSDFSNREIKQPPQMSTIMHLATGDVEWHVLGRNLLGRRPSKPGKHLMVIRPDPRNLL